MAPTRRRRHLPIRSSFRRRNLLVAAATSPAAKAAYAVIGVAGLAALAIAIVGPKRFQKEVLKPAQGAISDQAGQLWSDSKGLREQIADLFERARSQASREKLAQGLQSWIGHFRAT